VNTRLRTDDVAYVLRQSDSTTLITHDVSGLIDYLSMARRFTTMAGQLQRLVIKSECVHPGTFGWAELLERGRAVDDATVTCTRPPCGQPTPHSSCTPRAPPASPKGSLATTASSKASSIAAPLGSMMVGNRQILTEGFDPDEALDLIEQEGGTQVHGFEGHLRALCDAQEARPRNLRTLRTGLMALGQASAATTAYRARTVLAPARFLAAYGITEVGANVSVSFPDATDEQACETSGYPCEGFAVRVIDPETGQEQPRGVAGELLVQSRYMM
jgi:fatty-acyl-CoA synthase